MDIRRAFMESSGTLLRALSELSHYRIVGNTVGIAALSVHVCDRGRYVEPDTPAIAAIRAIAPLELALYTKLFHESSIIVAYSWLEAFVGELEEVFFLHDPVSLGEETQVKLGKVLAAGSIDELIHDLARRRVRERAQWGLRNRVAELRKRKQLAISVRDDDLEWLGSLRNDLVHNRRVGEYRIAGGRTEYRVSDRERDGAEEVRRYLSLVFQLLSELYVESAKALRVTSRFAKHKRNLELIGVIQRLSARLHPSQGDSAKEPWSE